MKSLEDKIAQVQKRPNNLVFVFGSMLSSMLELEPYYIHLQIKYTSRHYLTTLSRTNLLRPSPFQMWGPSQLYSTLSTRWSCDNACWRHQLPALSKHGEAAVAPIEEQVWQLKQDLPRHARHRKTTLVTMCLCASFGSNGIFFPFSCAPGNGELSSRATALKYAITCRKSRVFELQSAATLMQKLTHQVLNPSVTNICGGKESLCHQYQPLISFQDLVENFRDPLLLLLLFLFIIPIQKEVRRLEILW